MIDELSETDWQELAQLIEDAPTGRLHVAMKRLGNSASQSPLPATATGVERLVHLSVLSSDRGFDRALLQELRRLNIH
jgi:hypothetical protein